MLITNGTVLTFGDNPRVLPGGAIYIEEDTIMEIGSSAELTAKHQHEEVLDAEGKIVMPGLICGHTHFYGAFARGLAIPGVPPDPRRLPPGCSFWPRCSVRADNRCESEQPPLTEIAPGHLVRSFYSMPGRDGEGGLA